VKKKEGTVNHSKHLLWFFENTHSKVHEKIFLSCRDQNPDTHHIQKIQLLVPKQKIHPVIKTKMDKQIIPSGSRAVVKRTKEDALKLARANIAESSSIVIRAEAKPLRGGGLNFPGSVTRTKKNATTAGFAEGYSITVVVGSLKGVRSADSIPGSWTDDQRKEELFVFVPLHVADLSKRTKGGQASTAPSARIDIPRSIVTGKPLTHTVLNEGKRLRMFTTLNPTNLSAGTYVYAMSAEGKLSRMPPKKDKPGEVSEDTIRHKIWMERNEAYFAAPKPDVATVAPSSSSSPQSGRGVFIAPAVGRHAQKRAAPDTSTDDGEGGAAIAAASPADTSADDFSWYKPTPYARMYAMPPKVLADYFERSSPDMTDLERRCLEMEFPEYAPNSGSIGGDVFCMNWTCKHFDSVIRQEYTGQWRDDQLALFKLNPGVETILWDLARMRIDYVSKRAENPEYMQDNDPMSDELFIVVAQSWKTIADVHAQRMTIEVGEPGGVVPVIATMAYGKTDEHTGKLVLSPDIFSKGMPKRNALEFSTDIKTWDPKMSYSVAEAENKFYRLKIHGTVYEEQLAAAIGITSEVSQEIKDIKSVKEKKLEDWTTIAKMIIARHPFTAFVTKIDWGTMKTLPVNKVASVCDSDGFIWYYVTVMNMFIDIPEFLSTNAVPVTMEGAAAILNMSLPSKGEVDSSIPNESIGSWVCLSEGSNAKTKFAATIKAKCDYYVLISEEIRQEYVEMFTPEMGDAFFGMSKGEDGGRRPWNMISEITLPIREVIRKDGDVVSSEVTTKKMKSNDPIFIATQDIPTRTKFMYVYAVRKVVKTNIRRAERTLQIFDKGGVYDMNYQPIIEVVSDQAPISPAPAHPPPPLPSEHTEDEKELEVDPLPEQKKAKPMDQTTTDAAPPPPPPPPTTLDVAPPQKKPKSSAPVIVGHTKKPKG
jgi:hypothetical protein